MTVLKASFTTTCLEPPLDALSGTKGISLAVPKTRT